MKIKPLISRELAARDETLDALASQLNQSRPIGVGILQGLYDAIKARHRDNEDIIIALGLAFGEHLAAVSNYEWVRVEDEYGEETALSPAKTSLIIFPISMLQKRIERNEDLDMKGLAVDSIQTLEGLLKRGEYDAR